MIGLLVTKAPERFLATRRSIRKRASQALQRTLSSLPLSPASLALEDVSISCCMESSSFSTVGKKQKPTSQSALVLPAELQRLATTARNGKGFIQRNKDSGSLALHWKQQFDALSSREQLMARTKLEWPKTYFEDDASFVDRRTHVVMEGATKKGRCNSMDPPPARDPTKDTKLIPQSAPKRHSKATYRSVPSTETTKAVPKSTVTRATPLSDPLATTTITEDPNTRGTSNHGQGEPILHLDDDDNDDTQQQQTATGAQAAHHHWNRMYGRLLNFRRTHGHCRVPSKDTDDIELSQWVTHVRENADDYSQTDKRRGRLDRLGFSWSSNTHTNTNTKSTNDAEWLLRFQELKDFKAKYGHCNVTASDHPALEAYVQQNRRKHQEKRLNAYRKGKLDSLGLTWRIVEKKKSSGT